MNIPAVPASTKVRRPVSTNGGILYIHTTAFLSSVLTPMKAVAEAFSAILDNLRS